MLNSTPRVHLNDRYPPKDHQANCPVIIPLGIVESKRKQKFPFASIIALDPGDDIAGKPRLCINVWRTKSGGYLIGDGVIGIEDNAPMILMRDQFPELVSVLKMKKSEWGQLLKAPSHSKPYTVLKNWQEGDLEFGPTNGGDVKGRLIDEKFGPTALLKAMVEWNSIQPLERRDRVYRLCPEAEQMGVNLIDATMERLDKHLRDYEVKHAQPEAFESKCDALLGCIDFAYKLYEKIGEQMLRSGSSPGDRG